MKVFVFSRTLDQHDHPDVTVVAENQTQILAALREASGNDIWLAGGGALFRSLAEAKLVDSVEVMIVPVLLGVGTPLLPMPTERIRLILTSQRAYPSGIVSLSYTIG